MRTTFVTASILTCFCWLTMPTAGQAPATPAPRVPVIYCTDLFHPHDDPDDHFDLATLFMMPQLDIKVVVLDHQNIGMTNDADLLRMMHHPR